MSGFILTIDSMDNSAFSDGSHQQELARILKELSINVENGLENGFIRDVNGNKVGKWSMDAPCDELSQNSKKREKSEDFLTKTIKERATELGFKLVKIPEKKNSPSL